MTLQTTGALCSRLPPHNFPLCVGRGLWQCCACTTPLPESSSEPCCLASVQQGAGRDQLWCFARLLAAAGPAPAANATCRVAATSGVAWRAAGLSVGLSQTAAQPWGCCLATLQAELWGTAAAPALGAPGNASPHCPLGSPLSVREPHGLLFRRSLTGSSSWGPEGKQCPSCPHGPCRCSWFLGNLCHVLLWALGAFSMAGDSGKSQRMNVSPDGWI